MSEREAFGPNLRRIRIQKGISLEQIAASAKVNAALWAGLERNDFSRWPAGIYARGFVRQYARAIGVDVESTVDAFCRYFPQGDRRAEPLIRGHAEIVGHRNLAWRDHVPPVVTEGERRGSMMAPDAAKAPDRRPGPLAAFVQMFVRLRRALPKA
jgi:transcriptional regulator with XRE-family HTH domain